MGRRHSPASGRCPLLCAHFLGLGVRRLHHRRVLPEDHRLADLHQPVHRTGPGRPGDGRLAAETSGGLISLAWCITPTAACSIEPSATGPPWWSARRSPRRVPRGTPFGFGLAEALNSLYKAELIRNQGPWEDIDAARGRRRRVGALVRAPFALAPPSSVCVPPPSTKPPGSPTSARTARNNHNRQPPAPNKPPSTKRGA